MKKECSLAWMRNYFGQSIWETDVGFIFDDYGKYKPDIRFLLPKQFYLGKDGNIISPVCFEMDKEVTDSMNLTFDGDASFLFGDFWYSKDKKTPCFMPKDPMEARHLLLRISWGGACSTTRGMKEEYIVSCNPPYYKKAQSNAGGSGYDYLVLPVGYKKLMSRTGKKRNGYNKKEIVDAYCRRLSNLRKMKIEDADVCLRKKAELEKASVAYKATCMERLNEIQSILLSLRKPQKYATYEVYNLEFGDVYFKLGIRELLYCEESLTEVEKYLEYIQDYIKDEENERYTLEVAKREFGPKFESLSNRILDIGWKIDLKKKSVVVWDPTSIRKTHSGYTDGSVDYPYSAEGFSELQSAISAEEERIYKERLIASNTMRVNNALKSVDLPENLWFLFDNSSELESAIRKKAEAILAASALKKDEADMRDLCYSGISKRRDVVNRLLIEAGGDSDGLYIDNEVHLTKLALFLAGWK